MPSQAVKDVKFGFFVGIGLLFLGFTFSIIVGMSMWAVGRNK
jgi:hypothetical protein